jgi:hypothetical protein
LIETSTEHITHTILANMVQQFEQFIEQPDVVHKLQLSVEMGSRAHVSTPLLVRLCHFLESMPEHIVQSDVSSRLRRVAELCVQQQQQQQEEPDVQAHDI